MEHELPEVLEGVDEPVTVEGLEDVVRRAGQRRRARLVAGAAALLAAGSVGGALARGPVRDHQTGLAADQPAPTPTTTIPGGPGMASFGYGATISGPALTPLFRREANGVAIRAFRATIPGSPAPEDVRCAPPNNLVQGEFSTAAAVGMAVAPAPTSDAFAVLGTGQLGREEGDPVTWAIVRAGTGVATVRVTAGASTDAMAPKDGIAILALAGTPAGGVVEGLGADGAVVSTRPLAEPEPLPPDPACFPPPCLVAPDGSVTGPATTYPSTTGPADTFTPTTAPGPTGTAQTARASATTLAQPPGTRFADQGSPDHPMVMESKPACGSVPFPEGGPTPPMPPMPTARPPMAPTTSASRPPSTATAPGASTTTVAPATSVAPPPSTAVSPAPSLGA